MEGILAALGTKVGLAGLGIGVAALFFMAKKFVPGIIGRKFAKHLDELLDMDDDYDRELVLALMVWAEHKIPDAKAGTKKAELVADKIVKMFPKLSKYKSNLASLIAKLMKRLDGELKKRL